jgi:hypothetical protein
MTPKLKGTSLFTLSSNTLFHLLKFPSFFCRILLHHTFHLYHLYKVLENYPSVLPGQNWNSLYQSQSFSFVFRFQPEGVFYRTTVIPLSLFLSVLMLRSNHFLSKQKDIFSLFFFFILILCVSSIFCLLWPLAKRYLIHHLLDPIFNLLFDCVLFFLQ